MVAPLQKEANNALAVFDNGPALVSYAYDLGDHIVSIYPAALDRTPHRSSDASGPALTGDWRRDVPNERCVRRRLRCRWQQREEQEAPRGRHGERQLRTAASDATRAQEMTGETGEKGEISEFGICFIARNLSSWFVLISAGLSEKIQ